MADESSQSAGDMAPVNPIPERILSSRHATGPALGALECDERCGSLQSTGVAACHDAQIRRRRPQQDAGRDEPRWPAFHPVPTLQTLAGVPFSSSLTVSWCFIFISWPRLVDPTTYARRTADSFWRHASRHRAWWACEAVAKNRNPHSLSRSPSASRIW